jgi:hypothetical protein
MKAMGVEDRQSQKRVAQRIDRYPSENILNIT